MTVLVTGGAGYIGSHVVRLLEQGNEGVVVVDDLSTGRAERVSAPLVEISLESDSAVDVLDATMEEYEVDAVIHFAALKQVPESMREPSKYFRSNVGGLANLLLAMERNGIGTMVFSSSAAVYGSPAGDALPESTPTAPINPYGETKLVGEWMLADATRARPLAAASLRYFNVGGAGWPELADTAVLNLVPMVLSRIESGSAPLIFGDDYPTPDGTCVRDFVHVMDLARAHLDTLAYLRGAPPGHRPFNVGTGRGSSVREVIDALVAVSGSSVRAEVRGRRDGDPASVVADPSVIADVVGWSSTLGLRDIVSSAWEGYLAHAHR